jgi:hypothetical protein
VLVCSCCHNKTLRPDVLNNRNLISHSSGDLKTRWRFQPGQFLVNAVYLTCRWPPSPMFLMAFSFLLIRMLILLDQDAAVLTSCNLNYLHKGSISE